MMDAEEAERAGLVARVVEAEALDEEAMKAAATIAGYSKLSTVVAKDAVGRAQIWALLKVFRQSSGCCRVVVEDQKEHGCVRGKRPPVEARPLRH